jgi:amidohydrolase
MTSSTTSPELLVSAEERAELVRLRRDFHRHPELGFQEIRTSGIVAARLRDLGYDVRTGLGGTGVLGSRGQGGRALFVRADMDALPIREANDVEYKSVNDGVMHACGHDAHTAVALMAAARFASTPFPGRVAFGFQPAEEVGEGADRMIADGALDGVDAALGLHLWNSMPVGKVGVTEGAAMASVDDFDIIVRGRGGHAAAPDEADDPIVKAAAIIQELQTIVSRRVDPFSAAVVSVTWIEAGSAYNVIPEFATLRGTIRTFDESVKAEIHRRVHEVVGMRGTVEISKMTRVLVNDPAMCRIVREAAASVVGAANVVTDERTGGGEDFASVLATVPGCFFFVGSKSPQSGGFPHHHPRFDVDERSLAIGLEILTRSARAYLEQGFGA